LPADTVENNKPSERQTGLQTKGEDKPTLEDYKSEEEPGKKEMKPKEASDEED
jgi:hypothetical protein